MSDPAALAKSSAQALARPLDPQAPAAQPLKRRGLLIGAGAAGAAVLAVKALPGVAPEAAAVAAAAPKLVDTAGGYQLSAHVLRYYETARA